jgi:hypothetical protein
LTNIKLYVNGAHARAQVFGELVAGTVGITIDAKFNDEWNDLAKHLVCRNGKVVKTKLDFQNGFTVAPETMIAGGNLEIGFDGISQDGNIVFPTVWASCGVVKDGANANDDYSADPTNPVWDQLEKQIGDLSKLETSAKDSIVKAVNEVAKKDVKIPVATTETLGGIKAEPATEADTQPVRIGADGMLYTAPGGGSGGTDDYSKLSNKPKINGVELSDNKTSADLGIGDPTDEQVSNAVNAYLEVNPVSGATFEKHRGNLWNGVVYTKVPTVGDNIFALPTSGSGKVIAFRAKPNTEYVLTLPSLASPGNIGQADYAGICTQPPTGYNNSPIVWVEWQVVTGGLGRYCHFKTNDKFLPDSAYIVWQFPGAADLTGAIVFEGSDVADYVNVGTYSSENGMVTSPDLQIKHVNLSQDIADNLHKAVTAVQPEDMLYEMTNVPSYNMSPKSKQNVGDSSLGDLVSMINSAVLSDEYLRTFVKLGSHYAHCPSVCVKDDIAYVVAFQNTKNTTDSYLLPEVSTELYVVDIATMTVLAQHKVAGHGSTVGNLTFTYGSGAAQGVLLNDSTIRTVFVAKLSDEEWHQCYRDFDIATSTFGDIGLCQIVSDGQNYDFTTANASLHIQAIGNTTVNTNIVCQPAFVNGTYYVACGCSDQWDNMPILKTTDWIHFEYWATPTLEGNKAKFEMAIATDGTYLYTATRQQTGETMPIMKVKLSDGSVAGHTAIPDGNASRPYILVQGSELFVSNILTENRLNSSQITTIGKTVMTIGHSFALPTMVYPTFVKCSKGYFVAFMIPYGLYCCTLSAIPKYDMVKSVNIAAKLISLVTGE